MYHSLSSSEASSGLDLDRFIEEEGSDEEDAFISFTTMESRCEQLFERGLELKCDGDLKQSVSCFLTCLKGIQECEYFIKLPQTLHHLGGLYKSLECYEEALEYSKAEKLFYEAVLMESQKTSMEDRAKKQKRRPFSKKPKYVNPSSESNPALYGAMLMKKSEEYDRLARVCASENKLELALDYCGNALSIRRSVFGQDHPLSVASLELFSLLYGGVGGVVKNGSIQDTEITSVNHQSDISTLVLKGHLSKGEQLASTSENQLIMLTETQCTVNGFLPPPSESNNLSPFSKGQNDNNTSKCIENSRVREKEHPNEEEVPPIPYSKSSSKQEETKGQNIHLSDYEHVEYGSDHFQAFHEDVRHHEFCTNGKEHIRPQTGKCVDDCHPHQEVNLCTGVTNNLTKLNLTNNLTKLSELKAPLCVNLDLHNNNRKGVNNTRCVPLWVLLLPAVLALVAYMLYYH